jgi:ABC-2 type transport system ATP-binding protein
MSGPSPWPAPVAGAGAGPGGAADVAMIELDHVSKWFGDVVAVSDVAFTIGPGITALLGPNGAGKSTVLRLMCGLARPSLGQVRVLGADPRRDLAVLGRIGLVPQQEAMFETLTAREFVETAARLLRLPDPGEATERALAEVEVSATDKRPVRALSKGNRQRVKVASALVHDPEIMVLDEPLNGLDPRQRLHLIELVRRLAAQPGRCVVISSHVLEEVERFGSRILVIAQGRLAAEGDFRAIRDLMDDRPHRLRISTDAAGRFAAGLLESGVASGVRVTGPETLEIETTDVHGFRRSVAVIARDRGLSLDEVVPLDDDLDSVFRYLVGR